MSVPLRPAHPERWFRARPDSSVLSRPRLLARCLIDAAELDDHIGSYERLLGVPADLRMPIPDFGGLELAAVGNLLLIASARPFTPIQRQTSLSLIVPSLDRQLELLGATGTTVLEPPEPILPGARARVRFPDGTVAELVEHRPWPGEKPRSADSSSAVPRVGTPTGRVRLLVQRTVHEDDFLRTVRLYEALLQATATAPPRLTGARTAALTAIVGNLLLVGLPALPSIPPPEAALIVPATRRSGLPTLFPAPMVPASTDGVMLPGGLTAEVWAEHDSAAGAHHRQQVSQALSTLLAGNDTWTVEDQSWPLS
ncbi:hypothetical protein A6A06_18865 [Streptomyces sp. CB02923]|uniref:VOC family protein n=1 Tax=Streptomyces sp. CB02923 TaxID=1718985 RepID=UPI00093C69CD|nr:hypothetical protein [Streptomyces sp. CB02923]OKI00951.1 hypothetical protein A6A06_18865 [Streptomyces sp. CB02923]